MKKSIALLTVALFTTALAFAQDEKDESDSYKGFKPEYMFTGGSLDLGFYSGGTVLGATPQLGYSLTSWLDAGIVLGYTYTSQRDNLGSKLRQTVIGPGAFARLFPFGGMPDFPLTGLFASGQFEHNFISQKYIYIGGTDKIKTDVSSFLVGLGYASGKYGRNSPYYFLSISFDVLKNPNSPYTNQYGDVNPVFNAGFNIPLFQGQKGRR